MSKKETFDMAALVPPTLNQTTTVKFNAGQFVSMKKDKVTKHYRMEDRLGSGGYGEVFLCKHKGSGSERAVKVIEKGRWNAEEEKQFLDEFAIVKDLDHPNILKMYETFEDLNNFYIVTDVYGGGELFDEVETNGNFLEEDAAILMNNVLACVNYCHQKNIVHRDLKPENILLTESKKLDDLKIIDFGLAQYLNPDERLMDVVGSAYYKAPEVLSANYGQKCDVWSCGVIAFIVLCGYAPFDGDDDQEIEDAIRRGEFDFDDPIWDLISEDAKDFIEGCLTYNERSRPTAAEALSHPWLEQVRLSNQDEYKQMKSEGMNDSLSNMAKFHANSKLKQATLAFIASQLLLIEEKEVIDEVFRALDTNSDGKLTPDEIKSGYKEFYDKELTDEEVHDIVKRVNFRGNGAIDYSEFLVASMFEKNLLDEKRLKAAFKMFDKDKDGYIDADNLTEVMASFGDSSKEEMDDYINNKIIREFDADGDGVISYEDFKAMMFQTVNEPPAMRSRRRSFVDAVEHGAVAVSAESIEKQTGKKKSASIKDIAGAMEYMSVLDHAKESVANPLFRRSQGQNQRFASLRISASPKKNALPPRTTTRESICMVLDGSSNHSSARRGSATLVAKNNPLTKSLIDEEDEVSDYESE